MAERGMHPLLMWWEEESRKVENKAPERFGAQMTGLQSPQRKRFLRAEAEDCLLYTSPSPRDGLLSRMPSSA